MKRQMKIKSIGIGNEEHHFVSLSTTSNKKSLKRSESG